MSASTHAQNRTHVCRPVDVVHVLCGGYISVKKNTQRATTSYCEHVSRWMFFPIAHSENDMVTVVAFCWVLSGPYCTYYALHGCRPLLHLRRHARKSADFPLCVVQRMLCTAIYANVHPECLERRDFVYFCTVSVSQCFVVVDGF